MNVSAHDDVEAYALGALDAPEARAFEDHLVSCAACRAELGSYAPVMQALREVPIPAPPPLPHARPGRRLPPQAVAAAAAAAIFVAGLGGGRLIDRNRDAAVLEVARMEASGGRDLVILAAGAARLRVVIGAQRRRTAFVLSGVTAPPSGKGYQVWIRGAAVRSPGMLQRTASGLDVLVVDGDAVSGARTVGVTIEPAAGAPMRTGPTIVAGALM